MSLEDHNMLQSASMSQLSSTMLSQVWLVLLEIFLCAFENYVIHSLTLLPSEELRKIVLFH